MWQVETDSEKDRFAVVGKSPSAAEAKVAKCRCVKSPFVLTETLLANYREFLFFSFLLLIMKNKNYLVSCIIFFSVCIYWISQKLGYSRLRTFVVSNIRGQNFG